VTPPTLVVRIHTVKASCPSELREQRRRKKRSETYLVIIGVLAGVLGLLMVIHFIGWLRYG
jgi:hypothetical protein